MSQTGTLKTHKICTTVQPHGELQVLCDLVYRLLLLLTYVDVIVKLVLIDISSSSKALRIEPEALSIVHIDYATFHSETFHLF